MDEAVLQCVQWCLTADNPLSALAELTDRMRANGWSESDIKSVNNLVSIFHTIGAVSVEAVKPEEMIEVQCPRCKKITRMPPYHFILEDHRDELDRGERPQIQCFGCDHDFGPWEETANSQN
jgi:hypothetical protein